MTIYVSFAAKNMPVLCVNMCFSNSGNRILYELQIKDQEKWVSEFYDDDIENTFTDQKFIDRFGTHAFVMGIFQKIMTSWESFLMR